MIFQNLLTVVEIKQRSPVFLLLFLLLIQLGLFEIFLFKQVYFYVIVLSIIYILFFALSVHRSLLLLLFIIIVFQEPRYQFEYLPFALSQNHVLLIFTPIIFYWILASLASNEKSNPGRSNLSVTYMVYFIIIAIALCVGIIHHYQWKSVLTNFLTFFYFITYFIVLSSLSNNKQIYHYIITIFIASVIAALQYIYSFFTGQFSILSMGRIVTGQIHIIYLMIPFLLSFLINNNTSLRFYSIVPLFILVPAILISQTRGTWIACIVAIGVNLFIYFKDRKYSINKITRFSLSAISIVVVIFLVIHKIVGTNMMDLVEQRVGSIANWEQDTSLNMRAEMNAAVWKEFLSSPIWGKGLGAIVHVHDWQYQLWIDNTYMVLLWKFGILGFLCFITILFVVLKRSYYVYAHTDNMFYKWFSGGTFSAFMGLAVLGLISPVLIKYRFNIIWALIMACIEYSFLETKSGE